MQHHAGSSLDLNNPDTRRALLGERLKDGTLLVAGDLAREFGVSIDTVRRDLIALESEGAVRRVRGGALPVRSPAPMLTQRRAAPVPPGLVAAALAAIGPAAGDFYRRLARPQVALAQAAGRLDDEAAERLRARLGPL